MAMQITPFLLIVVTRQNWNTLPDQIEGHTAPSLS
jgi:hypothetical protein